MKDLSKVRNTIPPSRKGAKMSEDTKRRISETCKRKGIGKWMNGRKPNEETRKRLVENNSRYWLGKKRGPLSKEWREKIGKALIGRKPSQRMIENVRNINKNKFGSSHPVWKTVKVHPLYKAIRESYKYRNWRKTIFQRDDFTCVLCGTKGVFIEADHFPKTFISIIKNNNIGTVEDSLECSLLWDINNGRTLCKPCHFLTPTWGRRSIKN